LRLPGSNHILVKGRAMEVAVRVFGFPTVVRGARYSWLDRNRDYLAQIIFW
jgi:hypothetical protein